MAERKNEPSKQQNGGGLVYVDTRPKVTVMDQLPEFSPEVYRYGKYHEASKKAEKLNG